MTKYRKKPVEIEAWQLGSDEAWPIWIEGAIYCGEILTNEDHWIIKTLEGDHKASHGDYIIKGVKNELYPCKPDIFRQTYEVVEGENELKPHPICDSDEFKTFDEVPESWLDRCSGDGYERYIDEEGNRRYKDNDVPVGDMPFRPCARCGHYPNQDGDDHCIQGLGHVVNACCGHGTHEGYVMFDDGRILRGNFTVEHPGEDNER